MRWRVVVAFASIAALLVVAAPVAQAQNVSGQLEVASKHTGDVAFSDGFEDEPADAGAPEAWKVSSNTNWDDTGTVEVIASDANEGSQSFHLTTSATDTMARFIPESHPRSSNTTENVSVALKQNANNPNAAVRLELFEGGSAMLVVGMRSGDLQYYDGSAWVTISTAPDAGDWVVLDVTSIDPATDTFDLDWSIKGGTSGSSTSLSMRGDMTNGYDKLGLEVRGEGDVGDGYFDDVFTGDDGLKTTPGTYLSDPHDAEQVEKGFTNLTLENASADVTWLTDTDDDGTFETAVASSTYTTSGNKTLNLDPQYDDWKVNVTLVNDSGDPTTTALHDEGVLFNASDPSGPNADPTGNVGSYDGDISLDVNDTDFGTAQGDSVQVVAENSAGGTIGSTSVSSNGTVTFPYTAPPGQSDITWRLTDSYDGDEVTVSQSFTLPAEVEIRNESNPSELVSLPNETVEVRFYFDVGGDPVIVTRNASDGTVNMTGLPADRPFTIVVDGGDRYVSRRIFVESLYDRQTVYLLPENESHVPVVFDVADYSGKFDQAESALLVQRAFNGSWGTVQGDLIGANERVSTQLKTDARHRLVIVNAVTGERKVLGPFTPVAASTQEVEITSDGEVSISGLDVMVTISPDIGILAARQTTLTGTVRSQNASIANATLTVEYLAPNGTTVLLAEQTTTSAGDIQATVDLSGRANGTVRAVTVYNTTAGASGSATSTFDVRPATTNQYALLNVLGTIPSMFPAASVEPFQIALSLLLTLAVTTAATAKVPLPTEAVAVFALAQLGMWAVLGWLPYTIPFAAGATAVGLAAIRRGL